MFQRRLRITAAAVALAAAVLMATPAHAAKRPAPKPAIGWFDSALQWMERLWKYGIGIDPNGGTPPPPPSGVGIDPNG